MENNLEKALSELVLRAAEGMDKSVEFMSDQLPEVIEQAMVWYAVKSIIYSIVGMFIVFIAIYAPYRFHKWNTYIWPKQNNKNYTWVANYDMEPVYIIAPFLLIPFIIGMHMLSLEWLQIWIAPKLWLIEYASTLVK